MGRIAEQPAAAAGVGVRRGVKGRANSLRENPELMQNLANSFGSFMHQGESGENSGDSTQH